MILDMSEINRANPIKSVTSPGSSDRKSGITKALEAFFKNRDSSILAQALRNHKINALCFDMDGTLANTEAINLKIVEEGLAEHGVSLSAEEKEEYVGTTIKSFSQMILERRSIDDPEKKANAISDSKDVKFPIMLSAGDINVFEEVVNLVKALHSQGFKSALVTSSKRQIMQQVLGHFNLTNFFNVKLGREDADGKLKPSPYIYNKARNMLGFYSEPERILVLEDSAPGIKSAHASGANVVVIKNLEEQNPTDIPSDNRIHRLDMMRIQ